MFDDCKEDAYESYPCPKCGSEVMIDRDVGYWFCTDVDCDFSGKDDGGNYSQDNQ